MKKFGKITAALLALVTVMSLFAACGKNDNKEEESTTDGFTLQVNNGEAESTEEYTTQAESTTEVTTKEEQTTKVKTTIKIPDVIKVPKTTKAPSTTKVPGTTKAPSTTKVNDNPEENKTTATPTTVPNVTEQEETLAPNVKKLLGCWEATFEVEGVSFYMQFEFKQDNTVETELTKSCYDKMINEIVERNAFGITQEELTEAGFDNVTEYKEALREYLQQELPFNELKGDFRSTGTWKMEDDKLKVTIDGETAVSGDGFMEYGLIFGLEFADGSSMSFSKIG